MDDKDSLSPNIFNYATSELTQDAFICWLAAWSHQKHLHTNNELHKTGLLFINRMLRKHDFDLGTEVVSPTIKQQHHNTDVVIEVGDFIILIEDKVHSQAHSNQLERYRKKLKSEFENKQIIPIYFQTGSQSSYASVKEKGYQPFLREDFIAVLQKGADHGISNEIFTNYHRYIQKIDSRFKSFQNKTITNWDWDGWKGFFAVLKQQLGEGGWNYVANPSGGFMGYWWNFANHELCTSYLQLENNKLCFKIKITQETNYSTIRNRWHKKVVQAGQSFDIPISKPVRFGHGQQMTVAILNADYRETDEAGKLDLEKTLQVLKKASSILEEARNVS
ncbi:MAG: PD-(D/E)XK nuclease family protein [Balneolaceae bacterium]|nr:PD-(D/E)XK nuclease family protein [Balneolaceae bacterium]